MVVGNFPVKGKIAVVTGGGSGTRIDDCSMVKANADNARHRPLLRQIDP